MRLPEPPSSRSYGEPVYVDHDPVYRRRRRVALAIVVLVVLVLYGGGRLLLGGDESADATPRSAAAPAAASVEQAAPPVQPAAKQGKEAPSAQSDLVRVQRITGGLTPKSVVASPSGLLFAQNMMYSHTATVYSPDGARVRTIDDAVDLSAHGVKGHPGTSKGAPVEMAFSPDGSRAYVSNYSMYGEGFEPEGKDACTSPKGISNSYLYDISTSTFEIERVIAVGAVPKYVAVTPDGSTILVTNWCSMDVTVIDAASGKVTASIPTGGKHPRGIAVSPDSKTAYVTVMGSDRTVAIDLASQGVRELVDTGDKPRHVVTSPDGTYLYITNSGSSTVSKVEAATGKVVAEVRTAADPRSTAISPDGGALYVVEYGASQVSKITTADMKVVDSESTDGLPIGITYEPTKKRVWVACYSGSLVVFDDSRAAA